MDEIVQLIASESTELSTLALHTLFTNIDDELTTVVGGHAHQTGQDAVETRHLSRREKVWADPLRCDRLSAIS